MAGQIGQNKKRLDIWGRELNIIGASMSDTHLIVWNWLALTSNRMLPKLPNRDRSPSYSYLSRLHVGFISSRNITLMAYGKRNIKLRQVLDALLEFGYSTLHHGGERIGADVSANHAAEVRRMHIICHPPKGYLGRKEYLVWNHNIIQESDIMIAMPIAPEKEVLRSGTWAAIRYARRVGVPIIFV